MSKVFISYRRDDSAGYAHAIYSQLVQHFSKDQVFMDVDAVEPGVDFVRVIEEAVGECDVLLALIGKRWANVASRPTVSLPTSRRDDPGDFVRLEISTALARDILIVLQVNWEARDRRQRYSRARRWCDDAPCRNIAGFA